MHLVADSPLPAAQEMLALIFSAKESVYKCLYPSCKKRLDFHDAAIGPCPDRAGFEVHLAAELVREFPDFATLSGQYIVHDGNVFTGIVLPA
jgi:enterobactin synthetase component D